MFQNYKNCLLNNKNAYRSQQRFNLKVIIMMFIQKKLIKLH